MILSLRRGRGLRRLPVRCSGVMVTKGWRGLCISDPIHRATRRGELPVTLSVVPIPDVEAIFYPYCEYVEERDNELEDGG